MSLICQLTSEDIKQHYRKSVAVHSTSRNEEELGSAGMKKSVAAHSTRVKKSLAVYSTRMQKSLVVHRAWRCTAPPE